MFEASGAGSKKKEPYYSQLLQIEDSLRFLEKNFKAKEDEESASILGILADRLAEIQEGVEVNYESTAPGKV